MKRKTSKVMHSIVVIILLLFISLFLLDMFFAKPREILAAENFIEKLDKLGQTKVISDIETSEFVYMDNKGNIDSKVEYTLIQNNNKIINIDKSYNIIGFSKKENKFGDIINITEDEAVEIAKKYISTLTEDENKFKEVRGIEGQNTPYYSIIFYKMREGVKNLDQEIVLQIDKYTGELDGYTNSYTSKDAKFCNIVNISEEISNKIINDYIDKLKLSSSESDLIDFGYTKLNEEEYVLAYVYNLTIKDKNQAIKKSTLKINAETGEIINFSK